MGKHKEVIRMNGNIQELADHMYNLKLTDTPQNRDFLVRRYFWCKISRLFSAELVKDFNYLLYKLNHNGRRLYWLNNTIPQIEGQSYQHKAVA